jgi:transposase
MGYIMGEARGQQALFPVALDDLIPADHLCRVIDAFVCRLDFPELGFVRAAAAETGRPGYDPRDLLKLYLYGYLQQVRSSRQLEAECRRNVEVMWLLGRLTPDYKSIAEFRRLHREAVTEAGAELVRFARTVGLVRGEWVAIDGSKFQAVASARSVAEREAVKRYLDAVEAGDTQDELVIDPSAVQAALEKLKKDAEPEAGFMRMGQGHGSHPAYNVQTAVDAAHALIVTHQVSREKSDNRSLEQMAEAARKAVGDPASLNVVADTGYSNGAQAQACEARGIVPHVPALRGVNNRGDGMLFDRTEFHHDAASDTLRCPGKQTLTRKGMQKDKHRVLYAARRESCSACALKSRCTTASHRSVYLHLHDAALERMHQRATPAVMRLRRCTVEHPFATLKYRIFGHPRFLLRGLSGARTEISLGAMAYNLKRMINLLGGGKLVAALAG